MIRLAKPQIRLKDIRIKENGLFIVLFTILPLIDSLNGIFTGLPVGKVYKMSLGVILLLNLILTHNRFKKKKLILLCGGIGYIAMSILLNILCGGTFFHQAFAIKFCFNILLGVSLFQSADLRIINGNDLYKILDISAWVFIGCYLIPYFLGVGNMVYSGDIGYKAFFIAQNELSLVVVVFSFFTAYKLLNRVTVYDTLRLACLVLCGMLLNTKTAIVACLVATAAWIVPTILKGDYRIKLAVSAIIMIGYFVLKDKIVSSIMNAQNRIAILTSKNFGDSKLVGLLSGRSIFAYNAWSEMKDDNFILKLLWGNGFCTHILTEMDFVDVFFYLGSIGLIVSIIVFVNIFISIKRNTANDSSWIRLISYVVIMIQTILAGHVLFMSMSGCYFILYLCFLVYYNENAFDNCNLSKIRIHSFLKQKK